MIDDLQLYSDYDQQQAYNLYVFERLPVTTVARRLKIKQSKVMTWIKDDDWNTSRRDLFAGAEEMIKRQLAHFVTSRKLPLLAKYYRLQNQLTERVEDYLGNTPDDELHPKELNTIASTIKTMYDVGANIVTVCGKEAEEDVTKQLGVQVNIITSLLDTKRRQALEDSEDTVDLCPAPDGSGYLVSDGLAPDIDALKQSNDIGEVTDA